MKKDIVEISVATETYASYQSGNLALKGVEDLFPGLTKMPVFRRIASYIIPS